MPAGILGPVVSALAKLLLPLARVGRQLLAAIFHPKVLRSAGFGTAGALATLAATHIVLTVVASVLYESGFGGWSQAAAQLLVYGPPTSLATSWAFAQTVPGVASIIGATGGALFGAVR